MKTLIISLALIGSVLTTVAQNQFYTRSGNATFFSSTPVEDIKAVNRGAVCVLDVSSGAVEVSMLNKSFEFKKALMQEHFNENYMESNTYPKSAFKGKVTDISSVDVNKDGVYTVTVKGDLTIHGVTKSVEVPGTIEVSGENLRAETQFMVTPEDYDIKIPGMVRDNIAKEMEVTIELDLQPLKK